LERRSSVDWVEKKEKTKVCPPMAERKGKRGDRFRGKRKGGEGGGEKPLEDGRHGAANTKEKKRI